MQRAEDILDRVKAYEVILHASSAQGNLSQGAKVGLQAPELLGERFPADPSQTDILLGLEETRQTLAGRGVEELLHLPVMTDSVCNRQNAYSLSNVESLVHLPFPSRSFLLLYSVWSVCRRQHGNTPLSAQAYATYGIILCGAMGDIEVGYQFGTLAANLVEKLNAPGTQIQCHIHGAKRSSDIGRNISGKHYRTLLEGYQAGVETGDLLFGAFNFQGYGFQAFWLGTELTGLEREMAKYSDAIRQLKQDQVLNLE